MKRIHEIDADIDVISPKMQIGASDWTAVEKQHIEKCYYSITKVSVGWGRTVDLGCSDCIQSAVNVIKNYLALVNRTEESNPVPSKAPAKTVSKSTQDWKASVASVDTHAKALGLSFPKGTKTKAQKIAFVEAQSTTEQQEEEDDLLGQDTPTKEQLVAILKAKTGEQLDPEEYTTEELLELVEYANSEDDDN
jgi:hypothetical protein